MDRLMARILYGYARWSMIYKVLTGSLISLIPPLLIAFILGRQGWMVEASTYEISLVLAVIVGSVIYLNYVSLRILFRPLFQLVYTVEQLQEGDFRARAPMIKLDRELSRVGGILNHVLDNLERSRKFTASRIIHALERERKRIARELHDETSQALTTLIINLEMSVESLDQLEDLSPASLDRVDQIEHTLANTKKLTENTLEEIRKLIFDLRPSILDDLGLLPAMRWYAMNKLEPLGVQSRFQVQVEDHNRLPPDAETTLFRIFQEALTNIIKHAEASSATFSIKMNAEFVQLEVRDDGAGFVPGNRDDEDRYSGLGLFGMQERARLLEGNLDIESAPGEGTRVNVKIPRPGGPPATEHRDVMEGGMVS